jgi:multicomponent Na+:H+ antiporter subunit E
MYCKSFLRVFFLLMICWVLLVWPFPGTPGILEKWMIGIALSAFVAYLEIRSIPAFPLYLPLSPRRVGWILYYAFRFFKLMFIANLDVAYRVLHPALPIKPGIVKVKTRLTNPLAQLVLANSITLTPGTLVVDMQSDGTLFVHWICVISDDEEVARKMIVEPFEQILVKIFE